MIRKSLFFSALASCFLLTGCGGGSSSSATAITTTTTNDPTFNLQAAYDQLYSGSTFPLSGSDSNGNTYTGSLSIANRGQKTLNGQTVTQVDSIISLTNTTTNAATGGTASSYFQPNWTLYEIYSATTGVTYTPNAAIPLPASAKIGDFGSLATLTGSDGSQETHTWQLTSAPNGDAYGVFDSRRTSGGAFQYEEVDRYTVSPAGNVSALKVTITYSNGTIITLSGPRQ